ncbi:SLAM family member 8-like [Hippopotamus amphibius kiboko]|uniref:SLAM family member 8-like n=1 Tax=Hippopotamus amphibius kiboko TaxID=575201 RepID=UPI002597B32E|nr:SLAM family member 8-like [Hippopotamus amphibius kiboko]
MTTLKIENLTSEDSGQYRARATLTGGLEFIQIFPLTVYEPVPLPKILVGSPSITPGWCNATLECHVTGTREDLNVTWVSKGLPRELEWRGTPGPAPNSWTLTVNLSLSQLNASLTCVLSNQGDQKTATLDLGEACTHDSYGQADLLRSILWSVVAGLVILGGGLYLWKTCGKKKMEMGRGARSQEDQKDDVDSIQYADLSQQESQEGTYTSINEQHLEEKGPLTTIYSEVCKPVMP